MVLSVNIKSSSERGEVIRNRFTCSFIEQRAFFKAHIVITPDIIVPLVDVYGGNFLQHNEVVGTRPYFTAPAILPYYELSARVNSSFEELIIIHKSHP